MTVQFLPDGSWLYVDPVGAPLSDPQPPVLYPNPPAPWERRQGGLDYIANSSAMQQMAVPREQIEAIRSPVPQQLMAPQMGMPGVPLTIEDVLSTDNWTPKYRSWISGRVQRPRRVDLEQQMYEGTPRAAGGSSVNPML